MFEGWSASMRWKKFLRWQFAEVCEAANTDLSNVFQICSSNAFGLGSPPVSLKLSRPRPLPGARNESTAFAESLRAVECLPGRKKPSRIGDALSNSLSARSLGMV
jgi:hypothetical protein